MIGRFDDKTQGDLGGIKPVFMRHRVQQSRPPRSQSTHRTRRNRRPRSERRGAGQVADAMNSDQAEDKPRGSVRKGYTRRRDPCVSAGAGSNCQGLDRANPLTARGRPSGGLATVEPDRHLRFTPVQTLRAAFSHVAANKGAAGVDHVTVEIFEHSPAANLQKLSEELA